MAKNDYLKHATAHFVTYLDHPNRRKEERRKHRAEKREKRSSLLSSPMFGLVPFCLKLFINNKKQQKTFSD